jgi:hypothetical protein
MSALATGRARIAPWWLLYRDGSRGLGEHRGQWVRAHCGPGALRVRGREAKANRHVAGLK